MKRILFKTLIALTLSLLMLASSAASTVCSADGTHGFYMSCDASVVNDKSDGFMIDFYSDSSEALATYWSNANWSMYTVESMKQLGYKNITGGGAYAGLQLCYHNEDKKGIMSMWRYEYIDRKTGEKKYLYADAVYGTTTTYDNEGSGTSCVMPFNWQNDRWYRELLYCWEDEETGYTFIGTWFYDYETEQWTLFAYYNTYLVDSYIKGDIGQFLENFVEKYRETYRSFRYRNIYFLPNGEKEWVGSPVVTLRSDGNSKAMGEAKLGVSEDGTYVWGSVDGKSQVDTDAEIKVSTTLKQDKTPTLGTPEIAELKVNGSEISWNMTEKSTPQLSYKIVVTDAAGKEIATKSGTRPEVTAVTLDGLDNKEYKCTLTVTDVFGKTASASYETDGFESDGDVEPSVPSVEPDTSVESEVIAPTPDSGSENIKSSEEEIPEVDDDALPILMLMMVPGSIPNIVLLVSTVAVCVGVVAAIVIIKKRKKR